MLELKKRAFTLLEIMVVLLITSFGIVLAGAKLHDVYREQRFLSEAQQVLGHLSMAQDLMLIMDTDVKVKFSPDSKNNKTQVWLEVTKPIEKERGKRIVERKITLSSIQNYEFDGRQNKDLTLLFSLGKMSKGTLILSEGKREYVIELTGYPSPISSRKKEDERNKGNNKELYPSEVYEKLYANEEE